jgi:hypothetical protein
MTVAQYVSGQMNLHSLRSQHIDETFMIFSELLWVDGICEQAFRVRRWVDQLEFLPRSVHEYFA